MALLYFTIFCFLQIIIYSITHQIENPLRRTSERKISENTVCLNIIIYRCARPPGHNFSRVLNPKPLRVPSDSMLTVYWKSGYCSLPSGKTGESRWPSATSPCLTAIFMSTLFFRHFSPNYQFWIVSDDLKQKKWILLQGKLFIRRRIIIIYFYIRLGWGLLAWRKKYLNQLIPGNLFSGEKLDTNLYMTMYIIFFLNNISSTYVELIKSI